jgi:hypothetical protein
MCPQASREKRGHFRQPEATASKTVPKPRRRRAVTKGVGEAWNGVGLRSGQLANLFGAITSVDLKGYANSTPGATASTLDDTAASGHQHLTDLKARFDKYVEDYNNQTPPDSSWYIPSV